MSTTTQAPNAVAKRAAHPEFIPTFGLDALREHLPLHLPVPGEVPPSPKQHYLSHYDYLGADDLEAPTTLAKLSPFEVSLRLIDFSCWRDWLAMHYRPTHRGQWPYDPVSMFLGLCLRREQDLSWPSLARLLAGEHGAGWRRLFGFAAERTPCASALRGFRNHLGEATFEQLCPLIGQALHGTGLVPTHSTFPGDPPERGVAISHDIMLHEARSRLRCGHVTDRCYQPAPRPCPARTAGRPGCDCQTNDCAQACRFATPLDPEARLIHYTGRNKAADLPSGSKDKGRDVYGYASNPDRQIDDRFACAWTLRTGLAPANADERKLFPKSLAALRAHFPNLNIGEVLGDAALGFGDCLDPIWELGALRMVDIRASKEDKDPEVQRHRGYNEHGHPVCVFGYALQPNGHDYRRRRSKWCCHQACRHDPATGPPDCPYLTGDPVHGMVVNVGRTLPDGSDRLAREIAYASDAWEQRYGRRNLSESRNGSCENAGLKRLPNFGLSHGFMDIAVSDFLDDLHTLGRLVTEATCLARATSG